MDMAVATAIVVAGALVPRLTADTQTASLERKMALPTA
jgi:hypothetical protein